MDLLIDPKGQIRLLYTEAIDLAALGKVAIHRASHVEPDPDGRWTADLRLSSGPVLGPYRRRSEALKAEEAWLEEHWFPWAGALSQTS